MFVAAHGRMVNLEIKAVIKHQEISVKTNPLVQGTRDT